MKKKGKVQFVDEVNGQKLLMVASINDKNDIIADSRSKRPVGVKKEEDIIYLQELNQIEYTKNNREKSILSFFAPNNVGILLSIANKSLMKAKDIYNSNIDFNKYNHMEAANNDTLNDLLNKTAIVYEFIEAIQTSIVFGYTAIEAFTNLSIDEDYQYKNSVDSKGIVEIYDKKAIERWLSLGVKISNILVDVYECESIKQNKIWNKFKKFEECRNQIIHQKSIDINNFYEKYFEEDIFEICTVPEQIIKFFFKKGKEKGVNNPLWPLVVETDNEMTIYTNPTFGQYVGSIKE